MSRLAALLVLATGCNYFTDSFITNDFSGDPFPIGVETTSGAVVIGLRDAKTDHTGVLDVLSPISLIDRGPDVTPSIAHPALTVLGTRTPGGPLDLPRAQFADPQVLTLHPCTATECAVGTPSAPRPFDALLGMSAFSGDALRLHLTSDPAQDQIFILPDVGGDNTHRTNACDAVLPTPFRGGGTMLVGGTELAFTNWRIAINTCLAPNPDPSVVQSARGADVLLVASTAIGISILSTTAYERYRGVDATAPAIDALPDGAVNLPSGPVTGKLTTVKSLALVGNSGSNPRAPCRQVYAHHLLAVRNCESGDDCPCSSGDFCGVPAVIELVPDAGLQVLVVPDADETLQALRAELRPDQPEVDGILGTNAMRGVELDAELNQVNNRVLGRCIDPMHCTARPQLDSQTSRTQVDGCLSAAPTVITRR